MHSSHHRLPRAGCDRIVDAETALATFAVSMQHPPRAETIALLLDSDRRGRAIVVVSETYDADAAIEVVECLTRTVDGLGGLVVATVRPDSAGHHPAPCVGRADVDRWLEMSELAEQVGVELVEWFVIGRRVVCPRDALGEAPRW